jgi:hypothetical protein
LCRKASTILSSEGQLLSSTRIPGFHPSAVEKLTIPCPLHDKFRIVHNPSSTAAKLLNADYCMGNIARRSILVSMRSLVITNILEEVFSIQKDYASRVNPARGDLFIETGTTTPFLVFTPRSGKPKVGRPFKAGIRTPL